MAAFDQARDDRCPPERALHHHVAGKPAFKPGAHAVNIEQRQGVVDGIKAPDQRGIIGADKAKRGKACLFHLFGEQKAKGLLGVATSKAVNAQMFAPVMGEGFHQQAAGFGQAGYLPLQGEPMGGVGGQLRPRVLLKHLHDAVGQQGGGGEFGAVEGGHFRITPRCAADLHRHFAQAFIAHHLTADQEGITGGQGGGKRLFHLTQWHAAQAATQADLEGFDVDDRAKVLADHGGSAGVTQGVFAIPDHQALPAVIGAQGIAAGGCEIKAGVELRAGEGGVGASGGDFSIKLVGVKRPGAGGGKDVLAQHVTRAGAAGFSIQIMVTHGLQGGLTFDHLKPICGHNQGLGRGVVAVVGAADALNKAFDVFRRTNLNDQIDIAPVDAQIKAAGADNGAQLACDHGGLDTFTLFAGKAAVVDADGQIIGVGQPEVMEKQLGLSAGVVKDERGAVGFDKVKHGGDGIAATTTGPGGRGIGQQHLDIRVGAGVGLQDGGVCAKKAGEGGGVFHRGRQADAAEGGGEGREAGEVEHELIAALGFGKGMDFIDDHALKALENPWGVFVR